MSKRGRLTRTQLRIVKAPATELRRVTLTEKIAHPNLFRLGGEYLIPKSIKKITARTAFVTRSRHTDFLEGVSHGVASAERKAGLRPYKGGAAAEEAAAKGSVTRKFRKRFRRAVEGSHEHTFRAKGDRGNHWSHAEFSGEHLVTMQNYRTDCTLSKPATIIFSHGMRQLKY